MGLSAAAGIEAPCPALGPFPWGRDREFFKLSGFLLLYSLPYLIKALQGLGKIHIHIFQLPFYTTPAIAKR